MRRLRSILRTLLAVAMVSVGLMHFTGPAPFVAIVPAFLPAPAFLVALSGACEILGGLGLLVQRSRRFAAWGLIALYVAVFPANVNMAVNHLSLGDSAVPSVVLWLRLPLQLVLIAWAYWVRRDDDGARRAA